jgi:hypothetical protein
MITTEIAFMIRFERGLRLPIAGNYENPRVKQIASLQARHFTAIQQLDQELEELAKNVGDYSI